MSGNKGLIAFIFSLYMKKINYMKTIETIKQMIADGQISQEVAEKYFPELRENKDVRMKNFISNELACLRALDEKGTVRYNELTEAMAWIEKQGEQRLTLPKWKYKNDNTPLLRDSLILNEYGCVAKSPSGALVDDVWVIDYDELLKLPKEEFEKQSKQETLCDKCRKEHPSHSCQDITALGRCAVEHEQKFYEGDWIACEELSTGKIIRLDGDRYEVEFIDGSKGFPHIDYVNRDFHLWTIQDAKDGDILYSTRVNAIILYKYRSSDGIHINAYCALQKGIFIKQEILWDRDFVPATREQRDLFFQKMKEADYEWDAKKKELKKLEKPIWNEEDERLFQIIIDVLDRQNHLGNISHTDLIACVRKLKSLRPKKQWKPSKEQMEYLYKYAEQNNYNGAILTSLYNDLKQL